MDPSGSDRRHGGGVLGGLPQELLHPVGGLGPILDPVLGAAPIDPQPDLARLGLGVVKADSLDIAPVTGRADIGDDNLVEGVLLGTTASQTDRDHVLSWLET